MTNDDEIHAEVQAALRRAIPGIVTSMGKDATDPETAPTKRMQAMDILLRVAVGPSGRPADEADAAAARDARGALSRALPLLEQAIKTSKSARIVSRASKLVERIRRSLGPGWAQG